MLKKQHAQIFGKNKVISQEVNVLLGWPMLRSLPSIHLSSNKEANQLNGLWERSWKITQKILLGMKEVSASVNAEFVIMYIPQNVDEGYLQRKYRRLDFDFEKTGMKLNGFCKENSIHFMDLQHEFKGYDMNAYYFRDDRHWNAAGNAFAANKMSEYLKKNKILSQQ